MVNQAVSMFRWNLLGVDDVDKFWKGGGRGRDSQTLIQTAQSIVMTCADLRPHPSGLPWPREVTSLEKDACV